MEYLKKYNISDIQIKELKEKYNEGIINFLAENELFIEQTIQYLQSEGLVLIFEMLNNNIKIFLETTIALKDKIEKMKKKEISKKVMQMILLNTELYDKI